MTRSDFIHLVNRKEPREFVVDGIVYALTYDKDSSGKEYVVFGRTFQGERYEDAGELLNAVKIGNRYLKNMLEEFD